MINAKTTLSDLAFIVFQALKDSGVDAVLSGGAVVSVYSIAQVEQLRLGESADQVLKAVGSPDRKLKNDGQLLWIYRDPKNGNQRAALGLNSDSKLLEDKTILLNESDA